MIKVGIIGGAGYTAGELIRLLINQPDVEIVFINSSSNAGNLITDVHEGLYGETNMRFTGELPLDSIDCLFFCTAHGDTKKFLEAHTVPENAKIIDLSPDSMVFELIGRPDKLDAFLKMFEGYNILELCRTGVTALERGGMHQHIQKPPQEVRSVQLPPPGARRA